MWPTMRAYGFAGEGGNLIIPKEKVSPSRLCTVFALKCQWDQKTKQILQNPNMASTDYGVCSGKGGLYLGGWQ